jgi:hypothetical protein
MNKQDILKEFDAMRAIGLKVPKRAYALLETENLADYDNMKTSDLADLLIQLAGVTE